MKMYQVSENVLQATITNLESQINDTSIKIFKLNKELTELRTLKENLIKGCKE
jgi:hypothetical protein